MTIPGAAPAAAPIIEMLSGRASDLGAGLIVNRLLPQRARRMVGPWCFLDLIGPVSFEPGRGVDVAPHPHIGLQTVTWLLEGELLHKDSLGSHQRIEPGQLNLMTAGAGIAHSEESPPDRGERMLGVQFWVALPATSECCEPAFEHHSELPLTEVDRVRIRVIMGAYDHLVSPARCYSPLLAAELSSTAAAATRLKLDPDFEHAVTVLRGSLVLEGATLAPGMLCCLGGQRETLDLALAPDSCAIVLGGMPFAEPVKIWWNFVAHREQTIRSALEDWNAGRRFLRVPGYQGERLEAPQWPRNGRLK
ncbi:putative quercetin 2,3-dioxygenase [Marinobacterium nitratireducens]|uniref:Quercetin 2,3-dioxygenase n=1 Tax=Marinobacterium nitratireducens TaxID=518897 RepID=A0A917ZNI0_9GAMM|nr:pirin family protein [Marinobacterium nitratireducens]GGO86884.1 putative quercetin 2,3-dioxygenase [Marinobacterium nitratireducens]